MARAGVILAAGMGTRMKSATPKCLHSVANLPMLGHVIAALKGAGVSRLVVVTSPDGESVRAFAKAQGAETVIQERQFGTGHAAASASAALSDFSGALIVANGDMPLVTTATYEAAFAAREKAGMAIIAFRPKDAGAYGRVITDADGLLDRIVEFKDANQAERAVTLCNAGIVSADARSFFRWAAALKNENAQGEYYLTDVPAIAKENGTGCAVAVADEHEVMGVNSRAELAVAESLMQLRLRARWLAAGVGMTAPETVFLSHDTQLEADVHIGPFVVFGPGVKVASGTDIKPFTHLEGTTIGKAALIGPFSRLRPGAAIGDSAHIGNFVEVKNTRVEKGAKANHLTYLGDARVGEGANVGAGTITCNYDGFNKSLTDIGAGAFIGSNAALVAPVTIGDGAIIGAGSVVSKDVPANAIAVARPEMKQVEGAAESFRARKRAEKTARKK
jgi:bifunctional UDP-N-acetylglucosamine pyrophosphorylase/glucosamine-1-phosphate N-acetyltransferase